MLFIIHKARNNLIKSVREISLVTRSSQQLSIRASLVQRGLRDISDHCAGETVRTAQQHALDMFHRRRLDEAIATCRASLETAPMNDALWQIQAVCFAEQGKYSEALSSINRALDLYPDTPYCWSIKSSFLAKTGRYAEAVECDDRAIGLDPGNSFFRDKKQNHLVAVKSQNGKCILIVDDQESMRDAIRVVLTRAGYQCRAVSGGPEALTLLESELGFDLLIHDLLNPHLDGISLLQQAKQRFQALPVIVATAIDDEAAELACLQNGAFAYLRKPLQIEQLLETVSRALSVKSVSKVAED